MGSIIDRIVPIAIELGHPFTAREMCEHLYGECDHRHMVNTHNKINRLCEQGYVREKERIRVGSQFKVYFEVIM